MEGEKKLVQIFRNGELVYKLPSLDEIREKARTELQKLPIPRRKGRLHPYGIFHFPLF
ncbi:hypothetical protein [Escherichia coli]|uniref:hypothetical protein n=1 Tax=Escherichia coli TaxID=562 RepID=UPI0034D7A19E